MHKPEPKSIVVVGLGYVGLPLAIALSEHFQVTGLDNDQSRIDQIRQGIDRNHEVVLSSADHKSIVFVTDESVLRDAEFVIVTVPTPVDDQNEPDLSHLVATSEAIGVQLKNRSPGLPPMIVIFESTTFPGCTEQVCGKVIARASGLENGLGFKLGYSPERTNFGDPEHNLTNVVKIVSAQDDETAKQITAVYSTVVKAGIHVAPNIRTAEAAKVIENVQRDLNIALVNELSMLFDDMELNTSDVLEAAATKWNFVPFKPGLVGGHCIPVDPYYMAHAARAHGQEAQIIMAGRTINERMPGWIASKIALLLGEVGCATETSRVLVLGMAFKADISDVRNSKVETIFSELAKMGIEAVVHDPKVPTEVFSRMGVTRHVDPLNSKETWDAIVVAVDHREFHEAGAAKIVERLNHPGVFVDISGSFEEDATVDNGIRYWRL